MLKWALVEKGTNFFHRVVQICILLLEREVWGHNPEIAQHAEKSYVTFSNLARSLPLGKFRSFFLRIERPWQNLWLSKNR